MSVRLDHRATALPAGDGPLVARARLGDEAAIAALVSRHNRRLYRVARAVLRNDDEAEDAVQESWVRAFTALSGFRGEASFPTWLTRIVLNEAYGRARRRRTTVRFEAVEAASEGQVVHLPVSLAITEPEADMARLEVRQLLQEAIDELPEPFRLTLVLRDIEGLSVEETAEALGVPGATVKTRLHRARKLVRNLLFERVGLQLPDLFPFDGDRCVRMGERVLQRLRARRDTDASSRAGSA